MNALVMDPLDWTDVGAVTDVPMRGARRVPTRAGVIAVFRTGDGQIFALKDACPHKGGPLSQGIVHGHAVTCPLHAWSIDLASGEPLGADRGKGCAPVVPVKVEAGRILVGRLEPKTRPHPGESRGPFVGAAATESGHGSWLSPG